MQVKEVMTKRPEVLGEQATIREAAMRMRDCGSGVIPVASNDKIIGMITDRDLTVRALAEGKSPEDQISDIIAKEVLYCYESDDVKTVLKNMHQQQVQRLIVLNDETQKDLVGMVSVGDIADKCQDEDSAKAIAECCRHYH